VAPQGAQTCWGPRAVGSGGSEAAPGPLTQPSAPEAPGRLGREDARDVGSSATACILSGMAGLLIVTAAGPENPTRASVPFHIAVNGARPLGTEVGVVLAGDAAELVKPDVIANVVGLGVPPLRDLLDKCLNQGVPLYV